MNYLLLNILIILISIFIYSMIHLNQDLEKRYRGIIIGSICLIGILLCMSYPFEDVNGHFYDLRLVLFVIGAFYGGYKVSIPLAVGLLTYRYMLDPGTGFFIAVVQVIIILLFSYYYHPSFSSFSQTKKIKVTSNAVLTVIATTLFIYLVFLDKDHFLIRIEILVEYFLLLIVVTPLAIYVIEYILQSRKIEAEIIEAEKLRVISELAASVSHEVKNPLAVTKGFLQLLYDKQLERHKIEDYLQLSLNELDRAEMIISDYLTMAIPSDKEQAAIIDVKAELEYIVEVMTPLAKIKGTTVKMVEEKQCFIYEERKKFRQCLMNLVKNAIEACQKKGSVSIFADCSNEEVKIIIKDTGIGMSGEELTMLGVPFHSTKSTGTGLGLMLVYNVVKAMNGKITAESEPDVGTTFNLLFPKVNQD